MVEGKNRAWQKFGTNFFLGLLFLAEKKTNQKWTVTKNRAPQQARVGQLSPPWAGFPGKTLEMIFFLLTKFIQVECRHMLFSGRGRNRYRRPLGKLRKS